MYFSSSESRATPKVAIPRLIHEATTSHKCGVVTAAASGSWGKGRLIWKGDLYVSIHGAGMPVWSLESVEQSIGWRFRPYHISTWSLHTDEMPVHETSDITLSKWQTPSRITWEIWNKNLKTNFIQFKPLACWIITNWNIHRSVHLLFQQMIIIIIIIVSTWYSALIV